jgi:hypothetical protein
MLHYGNVDTGAIIADVNEFCRECEHCQKRVEKQECGDGMGGHSWEEVDWYCLILNDYCPEKNFDCPHFKYKNIEEFAHEEY